MEHNDLDEWYRLENCDEYVNARDHMNAFGKKDKTLYSNVIYTSFPRIGDLPIANQDSLTPWISCTWQLWIQKMTDQTYQNRRYKIDVQPSTIFEHLINSMRETIT